MRRKEVVSGGAVGDVMIDFGGKCDKSWTSWLNLLIFICFSLM